MCLRKNSAMESQGYLEGFKSQQREQRDDFGAELPAPITNFLTQFRDWCFSGELTQLTYEIPPLAKCF